MKKRLRFMVPVLALLSLLLNACVLPATHRYNWIFDFANIADIYVTPVRPLVILLYTGPRTLVVGDDYPCGEGYSCPILRELDFFINGVQDAGGTIVAAEATPGEFTANHYWTPPAPGLYYIQAHVIVNTPGGPVNGDYSEPVQICVIGDGYTVDDCWPGGVIPSTVVPFSAPFSFSTPTLATVPVSSTLTSTPASARDCPSGTFFAEQTHQCLPVQIQPTKKASGCSRYDNASACTSNGCSWDKPSSTCH